MVRADNAWLSSSGNVVRILDDDGPVKYFEYESEKEPD